MKLLTRRGVPVEEEGANCLADSDSGEQQATQSQRTDPWGQRQQQIESLFGTSTLLYA